MTDPAAAQPAFSLAQTPGSTADWPAWPVYGVESDLLPTLRRWLAEDRHVAMAMLVRVVGSSPRPAGSEMAIADNGEVIGYVSGGCVEAEVAAHAREVIETGKPVLLHYGKGSPVLDVQLACGGGIYVLVWPVANLADHVQTLTQARQHRDTLELCVHADSGVSHWRGPCGAPERQRLRKRYRPRTRLVIAGRDPVVVALCQLAPAYGIEVVLLAPRGPAEPPADAAICHYDNRPLSVALADLRLDADTAVYTLTHHMEDDHAMLRAALASPAFCVGALGSRGKAERRRRKLAEDGVAPQDIARVHCPAGLNIGATEPREIALSILAQTAASRPRDALLEQPE